VSAVSVAQFTTFPGQLEFEDLVIASPSQVDTESAWGDFFVYAHNERCVLYAFHFGNFVLFCSLTPLTRASRH
jgi:hypothetical protein